MISGGPFSSAPISAQEALNVSGGTTVTLNPCVVTFTVPTITIAGSGAVTLTPSASIFTWVVPDVTVSQPGVLFPPSAEADWVVPALGISGSGSVSLAPDPAVFTWVVPNVHITGGVPTSGIGFSYRLGPAYNRYWAIVPSDTVDELTTTDAVYVGGTGDVAAVEENGTVVIFTAVPVGTILDVKAKRVNSTSTTATFLVSLRRV